MTSELAENKEDKTPAKEKEDDTETSKNQKNHENLEDKITANPSSDTDETTSAKKKDEVHLTIENIDKDLQSLIDKGSIYMLDENGDIRKVIKHEEKTTPVHNGGVRPEMEHKNGDLHPELEHNNGGKTKGTNNRDIVQTTTEGYEFSRILPGDPINSILGSFVSINFKTNLLDFIQYKKVCQKINLLLARLVLTPYSSF